MDATDENRGLAVFILDVCFHTAADQKLADVFFVSATSHMQRRGKMRVHKIGFGACPFKQDHKDLSLAKLCGLVEH